MVKAKIEPERMAVINNLVRDDVNSSKTSRNIQDEETGESVDAGNEGVEPHCKIHFVPSGFFNQESGEFNNH